MNYIVRNTFELGASSPLMKDTLSYPVSWPGVCSLGGAGGRAADPPIDPSHSVTETTTPTAKLHVPTAVDDSSNSSALAVDIEKLPGPPSQPARTVHGWKVLPPATDKSNS